MEHHELVEQQLLIEQQANQYSYDKLTRELAKRVDKGQADELKEGQLILIHSIDVVADKFKELFSTKYKGDIGKAVRYLEHEFGNKPRELAYLVIATIVRTISKEIQIPTTALINTLVKQVHQTVLVYDLEQKQPNYNSYIEKKYSHKNKKTIRGHKLSVANTRKQLVSPSLNRLTTLIGGFLIDAVIKSGANIIEQKNIFNRRKLTSYVVYTKECFRMVLQSREQLLLDYRKYPILVAPPVPWGCFDGSGGYYTRDIYKIPLVKSKGTKRLLREYFANNNKATNLYTVLNTLQQTPWKVNRKVLDVMDRVYRDNIIDDSSATNNPYLVGGLPYNGYLEAQDFVNPTSFGEIWEEGERKGLPKDKKAFSKYLDAINTQEKILASSNGKTIMTSLVLYNAKEYVDYEKIYFSYQYDFRGRIYPIQQHLQPQGSSEVKALLQFAEGCKIQTDEEYFWFLIHGANCYGFDKDEYEDRIKKIKEKHEEILCVAEAPLKYRHFWKDTDEPYLYLAWCFEYADYHANPSEFISHIPIALDATCSGIQIYSGLLLDGEGGKEVNVIGRTRSDIYSSVAGRVNDYLNKEEYPHELTYKTADKEEHSISTIAMANSIKGKITRKLTKRNTMTQPYSVTKFGMYEQLKSELYDMEHNGNKFWVGETWLLAKLLTELNDRAITETVKGARIGQEYLKNVTREVVRKGDYVAYTTPILNFPVIQKLHKTKVDRVMTPVGHLSIKTTIKELHEQKMINGIAPNFIHSLDALLLSLTVLRLLQDGCKNFHLIHDSYGVPVNQVVNLNKRVRESFIEVFKSKPLHSFVNKVCKDYETKVDDIMINTLNLDDVLNSRYIFS